MNISRVSIRSRSLGIQVRTVVIPSRNRRAPSKVKPKQNQYEQFQLKSQENLLNKKINEIQDLARSLKKQIGKKDELAVKAEINDIGKPIEDEDVDDLFTDLLGEELMNNNQKLLPEGNSGIALFDTPAHGIIISPDILSRMGDSVKNIVSKENQNWDLIIENLNKNELGFKNLKNDHIQDFLNQIPAGKLNLKSINDIQKMLDLAEIKYDEHIYGFLMKQLADNNETLKVQALFDEAISKGLKPKHSMYGHLIKAYSKDLNIDRINLILQKMYSENLEPSAVLYTNILRLCSNLKDYKQSEEIFQMMKFRSINSKPDIETYNTMIEISNKKNDLLRAEDLYRELLNEGLKPTVFTLNCLARVCSKNKSTLLQGWRYIIEINELKLEPNINTFEVMLRLAAKDGDLELARAMYLKIFEMQINSKKYLMNESSVFLLMAYREFKFGKTPQLLHYKEGSIIRRNTIALVDFLGLHQTIINDPILSKQRESYPPLLPLRNLINTKQIIAESNAVWAHHLLCNPNGIVTANIITYMRIAVEHGDKEEFLRRYTTFTYPNEEIIVIEDEMVEEEQKPKAIKYIEEKNVKIERNSEIYLSLLSGGRRFKDSSICEKAWLERGEYRKTIKYQKISKSTRNDLDFKFAYEMVLSLIELELIYDAVHVVKSSERQFKWSFYKLKPLYLKLIGLGDEKVANDISNICNKALYRK